MNIVLTGSLGHIGKPLTETLVKQGHQVTVISSQAKRSAEIEELGAVAATGALEDAGFLAETFAGTDLVYLMVPPDYSQTDQQAYYRRVAAAYAAAIQKTGVKRAVYLSSYGAELDEGTGFILGANHAEKILDALEDVAITFMRPGYFYYNLFGFIPLIKKAGVIASNYGGNDRINLVAPVDIATAIADEIALPAPHRKVRYVVSDERTAGEIAAVLGAALGKPDLKWHTISDAEMAKNLEQNGMPAHAISNMVDLGASIHTGVMLVEYDKHKPSTENTVKLEDFAPAFVAAYAHD
ncbi:MAG: NAD(P)H-binding protein [Mucilaginibacter polytrichastri]|nr:NAD(P)H-binding protein [Mucilaginibacter polytrichastri]